MEARVRRRTRATEGSYRSLEQLGPSESDQLVPAPGSAGGSVARPTASTHGGQLLVIFLALVVDIFAFTLILPLLPRMLAYYERHEASNADSLYPVVMNRIHQFKEMVGAEGSHLEVVLFGGLVGSLFSFLQFLVSPLIGRLSDRLGRKKALLITMIGNILSALLWLLAYDFRLFLMSRIVGGLSEGNVQLSIAMITDLTTSKNRAKGLALVGIAFAIGFSLGPMIGAYLSTISLDVESGSWMHPYSGPAAGALALLVLETLGLMLFLKESKTKRAGTRGGKKKKPPRSLAKDEEERIRVNMDRLSTVSVIHFMYLLVFSGMEFTLTFLTYDRFGFSNMQNGKLLCFVGVLGALVQAGYVRRFAHRVGEKRVVYQGMMAAVAGLFLLGPNYDPEYVQPPGQRNILTWLDGPTEDEGRNLLYGGASFLAFTSGTVVTCLTTIASFSTSSKEGDAAAAGELGKFRSWGQLGRSLGPIISCTCYWLYGSRSVYMFASFCMLILALTTTIIPN